MRREDTTCATPRSRSSLCAQCFLLPFLRPLLGERFGECDLLGSAAAGGGDGGCKSVPDAGGGGGSRQYLRSPPSCSCTMAESSRCRHVFSSSRFASDARLVSSIARASC